VPTGPDPSRRSSFFVSSPKTAAASLPYNYICIIYIYIYLYVFAWGRRRRLRLLSVVAPLLARCSCECFFLLSCACACDLLIFLQVIPPPASCADWTRSFTPVLLFRLFTEDRCRLATLPAAFLMATGGIGAGVTALLLYAQRYLDWKVARMYIHINQSLF